jgi:hypothetical protein
MGGKTRHAALANDPPRLVVTLTVNGAYLQ